MPITGMTGGIEILGPALGVTGGTGTVTNVGGTAPIASSGGAAPVISFPSWPADAPGALVNDGAGVLTWNPADTGGPFVQLQAATPGTPDTGNFNVSGTGIVGTKFAVGNPALGSGKFLISNTGGSGGAVLLEILGPDDIDRWQIYGDGSATAYSTTTGEAVRVTADGSAATALWAESNSGFSGFFQSLNAANTRPTVAIGGLVGATAPLLSLRGTSALDGATVSRICLSDTNTAATLSNACIVFETVSGTFGNLSFYTQGTDNDTPQVLTASIVGDSNALEVIQLAAGLASTFPAGGQPGAFYILDGVGSNVNIVSNGAGGFVWAVGGSGDISSGGTTFLTVPNTGVATFAQPVLGTWAGLFNYNGAGLPISAVTSGHTAANLTGDGITTKVVNITATGVNGHPLALNTQDGSSVDFDNLGGVTFAMSASGGSFQINADGSFSLFSGNATDSTIFGSGLAVQAKLAVGSGSVGPHALDVTGDLSVGGVFTVDVNGNIVKLNGQTMSWPAANAAGVLTNDGAGNLAWI